MGLNKELGRTKEQKELCISYCCENVVDRNNLREEGFLLLTVSEVSDHHGREGTIEQSSSHHDCQESEREYPPPFNSYASILWDGAGHVFLHLLVSPIWKCPHRYTQKCTLPVS
jgi:hypothetical protein